MLLRVSMLFRCTSFFRRACLLASDVEGLCFSCNNFGGGLSGMMGGAANDFYDLTSRRASKH